MRVLFDTNVIVDVLQKREPWFQAGSRLFLAVADRKITGCLTAKQVADIHFFSRKQFRGEEHVDARARGIVTKLMALFEVIDTMATDCENAIGIDNSDYEDAIMIASARRAEIDCIVTRDIEHFQDSFANVKTPEELSGELPGTEVTA